MLLRKWIRDNGYNISSFSDALDVDRSYIHQIIKGDKIPGRKLKKKILELTRGEVKIPEELKGGEIKRLASAKINTQHLNLNS